MRLEIGAAYWSCMGETVCGDAYSVIEDEKDTTISLVDGLGHGPDAAEASRAFVRSVEMRVKENDLTRLMDGVSADISETIGAQAAILRIDKEKGQLHYCGVGSVELMAVAQQPIRPVSMSGIVGRPIRKMMQFDYEVRNGDVIVLFSDGISSRLDLATYQSIPSTGSKRPAKEIAELILADYGRDYDDATCIIIICKD